jgi:hypothetical protein
LYYLQQACKNKHFFSCDIALEDVKFKTTSKQMGAGFELPTFSVCFVFVDKLMTMYQFSDVDCMWRHHKRGGW